MRRPFALLAVALAPALASAEGSSVDPVLDLESGVVWARRNDVAAPGGSGTRFSLAGDDFQTDATAFVRARAGVVWGRHSLFATFAPLRLEGNGRSGRPILFRDRVFTADQAASVKYRFDTYRLTYRYALVQARSVDVAVGATALLRDAEIRVSQPGLSTSERNTGFVPLLSFRVAWRFAGPFALALDGDALAAPQGRAEDVSLALEFGAGDLTFRAGYRVLEGGADTSRVYSFAWLNYVLAGVSYRM